MRTNQSTMKLKLRRIDVCDILLALDNIAMESDAEKWLKLHDEVMAQLVAFDKE